MRRIIRGRPHERGSSSGLVKERQRPCMCQPAESLRMGPGARVRELPIFRHTDYLQFDAKPEKPDPEPLGGPGSAQARTRSCTQSTTVSRASLPARPSAPKPGLAGKIKDALT
jgi:hypothetical protein